MRRRLTRGWALFMLAVVALGVIGLGYALWFKVITIGSVVQTGRVHASIERAFTDDDDVVDNPVKDAGDTGDCPDLGGVDDAGFLLGVDLNKDPIDGRTSCDPAASEDGLPDVPVVITDTAIGTIDPPTKAYPESVTNGDFLIAPNPACTAALCPTTGDGVDEVTTWTFDFTGDPDFPSFPPGGPLASALLTLTLTPKNALISTDTVQIQGLPAISSPVIQGLPVNVTSTVNLQLLGFYTSAQILGVLAANAGQIPMLYQDDAIVSFAQLDLESTGKPEPRYDKDVARCDAFVNPNDSNVAHIRKRNVYPSYFCTAFLDIHNDGTIPVKIAQVALVGMLEVAPGQIKRVPGALAPLVPSVIYDVDLDGDTLPDINLHITHIDLCQQIDPSQTVQMDVDQHVKQTAPQDTTLGYRLRIQLNQWNEDCPPPPPPPPPTVLADFGDAPSPSIPELTDFCLGAPASYPSLLVDSGPYHLDFTDHWLGPQPNTETAEPDAVLPNCDDWVAPPFDADDGCLALFIPPASGWVCIPLDGGGVFGPYPGTCPLAFWAFFVSVDPGAPVAAPRFSNVVVDDRCPGPDGSYGEVAAEWVLVNSPVTAAPGGTELKLTGLFFVDTVCGEVDCTDAVDNDGDGFTDEWGILPFWTRFETAESIIGAGWDGSGPAGGFAVGETEDWEPIGDPDQAPREPPPVTDPRIPQVMEALGKCVQEPTCSEALQGCVADAVCNTSLQRCDFGESCLQTPALRCAASRTCTAALEDCAANSLCLAVLLACPEDVNGCQAAVNACGADPQCTALAAACMQDPICRLFVLEHFALRPAGSAPLVGRVRDSPALLRQVSTA